MAAKKKAKKANAVSLLSQSFPTSCRKSVPWNILLHRKAPVQFHSNCAALNHELTSYVVGPQKRLEAHPGRQSRCQEISEEGQHDGQSQKERPGGMHGIQVIFKSDMGTDYS